MSNTLKWLWLSTMQNMTPFKISRLLERYGDIENIYNQTQYNVSKISSADEERLKDKSLDHAKYVYKAVCDCGAYIMTCDNPHYPQTLKNIEPMPYVLYMKGKPLNLDSIFGIGVVGTRNNTDYGARCASKISYELGKKGAVVISGMAMGIDCIAMHATVRAGAKTIGVLGCGIDIVYPQKNQWLYDEVEKTGLIISEYPPGHMGHRGSFPQRNRIIAGLSKGVLVVEGSRRSGSMITAAFAVEYNRDVFAVPRNIYDKNMSGKPMDGTNVLIQEGAKLVTCADDILNEYYDMTEYLEPAEADADIEEYEYIEPQKQQKPQKTKITEPKKPDISEILKKAGNETEKSVIQFLDGKEMYPDEIIQALDADIGGMGVTLTIMETKGIIKKLPDGRYNLNNI